jgi:hypothetical protein
MATSVATRWPRAVAGNQRGARRDRSQAIRVCSRWVFDRTPENRLAFPDDIAGRDRKPGPDVEDARHRAGARGKVLERVCTLRRTPAQLTDDFRDDVRIRLARPDDVENRPTTARVPTYFADGMLHLELCAAVNVDRITSTGRGSAPVVPVTSISIASRGASSTA